MRRFISVPLVFLVAAIALITAPLALLLSFLLAFKPSLRALPRMTAFVLIFALLEVVALARLAWVRLRYFDAKARLAKNYGVQRWWGKSLLSIGTWLYQLSFTVSGEDALTGPSAILVARHASVGDNVLPLVYFGIARHEPLRYILKKGLTWLPSLDFGGHSLPNLFVDRSGSDTASELDAVAALLSEAAESDSLLIYPEGTRFSAAKQRHLAKKPEMASQVARWPDLLPPRLGGITRLLEINPGKDMVFLCHTGFEGAAAIPDLANGGWVKQHIRIYFWRVPFDEIGADHRAFIFDQWDRMQAELLQLRAQ
jgi:1-acyl-sn-glycerol-3-phosphate acyltransferase